MVLDYQVEQVTLLKALIDAENWELLSQLYETEKIFYRLPPITCYIARNWEKIEGLRLHLFEKDQENDPTLLLVMQPNIWTRWIF